MSDETGTEVQPDPLGGLPSASRNRPVLSWGDERGTHRAVIDRRVTAGSSASADVRVQDPAASRIHCELVPREDGLWVRDLGSRNGTFVDEVLVESARLGHQSRLRLGSTSLHVAYDPTPTSVDLWPLDRFGDMVGRSVQMRELFARMAKVAVSEATVLVHGETGTGKELAARAIHRMSPRHEGPFVVVDCGAIPETLIESELFGHAKGAFTGATSARAGAMEAAHGGTVFLDEVGELPVAMQPKLLRFLESRTVRRVGENSTRTVDVRVVSATHRDLRTMVNEGAFREDLYFRLAVLPLDIPSLRQRPEDIPVLFEHFLDPRGAERAAPELLRELRARPWYGNVRELRNFVERARALGPHEALSMMRQDTGQRRGTDLPPVDLTVPFKDLRDRWNDHLEREYLRGMLDRFGGNVSAAAEAAGIDRTYVHRLMKKHGM